MSVDRTVAAAAVNLKASAPSMTDLATPMKRVNENSPYVATSMSP